MRPNQRRSFSAFATAGLADGARLIGYARVSTAEQSVAMQEDALLAYGVLPENLHVEKASGIAKNRPALHEALLDARPGDKLIVWKLDRIGRSMFDLINVMRDLEKREIGFRSLTEEIDTTTPGGKLILHVMGALAQFERDLIVERTKAGVRAHIARGGRIGAPRTFTNDKVKEAKRLKKEGKSWVEIGKILGYSVFTVRKYTAHKR